MTRIVPNPNRPDPNWLDTRFPRDLNINQMSHLKRVAKHNIPIAKRIKKDHLIPFYFLQISLLSIFSLFSKIFIKFENKKIQIILKKIHNLIFNFFLEKNNFLGGSFGWGFRLSQLKHTQKILKIILFFVNLFLSLQLYL